jgi:hypothetical protein
MHQSAPLCRDRPTATATPRHSSTVACQQSVSTPALRRHARQGVASIRQCRRAGICGAEHGEEKQCVGAALASHGRGLHRLGPGGGACYDCWAGSSSNRTRPRETPRVKTTTSVGCLVMRGYVGADLLGFLDGMQGIGVQIIPSAPTRSEALSAVDRPRIARLGQQIGSKLFCPADPVVRRGRALSVSSPGRPGAPRPSVLRYEDRIGRARQGRSQTSGMAISCA